MLKQFSIVALSAALIACGSDSSDSNTGIESEINPSLKGAESAPALSVISGALSDGSTIPLNTTVNGSIASYADLRYSFSVTEDQMLAVILNGDDTNDSDLDLAVDGVKSNNDGAIEAVVLPVIMGETVSIDVSSFNSFSTDFTLTVVVANRQSLQLASNEYVVLADITSDEVCDSSGSDTYNGSFTNVFNFKDAYVRELMDQEKIIASSVSGNTLNFTYSEVERRQDGGSFSETGKASYTVDANTGAVLGMGSSASTEVDNGSTDKCEATLTVTGKIVL